jgi:hypothetical protein
VAPSEQPEFEHRYKRDQNGESGQKPLNPARQELVGIGGWLSVLMDLAHRPKGQSNDP